MSGSPRVVIAGNWKMYKDPAQTMRFFEEFVAQHRTRADRDVLFFPPALCLPAAIWAARTRPEIGFGVQNIYWESEGAFTGEISAPMAAAAGARYSLIGHSERRHVFGETDAQVARKVAAAIGAGLAPVICVGEKLDERKAGRLEEVLTRQLATALEGVPEGASFLIAYEPVWAIGTGVNATPQDAASAHAFLRDQLRSRRGSQAGSTPILYGGSVKPGNAGALLAASDVDGLLVGGASLDPAGFVAIAAA